MTLPPSASGGPWAEPIGNGLCRLHLAGPWDPEAAALTAELFCRTAREHSGTPKELAERLDVLRDQPVPGMEEWLASYEAQGCPAVHHSEAFRAAYQPPLPGAGGGLCPLFPCAAGDPAAAGGKGTSRGGCGRTLRQRQKTALASCWGGCLTAMSSIWTIFTCPLPTARKTGQRSPGGNMDLSRFRQEVLLPARRGETVFYRPFDCRSQTLREAQPFAPPSADGGGGQLFSSPGIDRSI